MNPDRTSGGPFPGLAIHLELEDSGWNALLPRDAEAVVRACVEAAAARAGLSPDLRTELGVRLTGDSAVKTLNAAWRGKDKPTNILSFPVCAIAPGQTPGALMGDLVLARETLQREAREERKPVLDHFRHLIVHGTLHLLGYDHQDEAAARAMEGLEIRILADLSVADPYADA